MSVQARRSVDGAAIVDSRGPQVYQCCRPLLLISRSLFPDVQASFDSYLRYACISVGLFCAYNRSLLCIYSVSFAYYDMLADLGNAGTRVGLFLSCASRSLMTYTQVSFGTYAYRRVLS